MLYGRNCLYRLARNIRTDDSYGHGIRRLELFFPVRRDYHNIQIGLIHLLEGCYNLAEIIMHMSNPLPLVSAMIEKHVHLPRLELVLVENKDQLLSLGFDFLNLVFIYKATLNQLHISVYIGAFSRFLAVDNISDYLHEFTMLKSCPQLQKLSLHIKPASFQVQQTVAQEQNDRSDIQLEELGIDGELMAQELYMYPVQNCKHLDPVLSTFHAFDEDMSLQITNLKFKTLFPATSKTLLDIGYWFPTVRQVELRGSDLTSLINQHCNALLDFNDLNLHLSLL